MNPRSTVLTLLLVSTTMSKKCIDYICEVESNCKNPGCKMDVGSLSCGPYQIKLPYYIDCGTPEKKAGDSTTKAWKHCAQKKSCAKKCVQKYYDRYKKTCSNSGKSGCEIMSRNHNGGPQGCKSDSTIGYWNKIKAKGCK